LAGAIAGQSGQITGEGAVAALPMVLAGLVLLLLLLLLVAVLVVALGVVLVLAAVPAEWATGAAQGPAA